ncbi:MAG: protein kinase [Pirellulales bacterium]|nr:protein kinase [Pirellulales bacterium]
MQQSVLQFWQLVAQSGLLNKPDCNAQAVAFADAHEGREPESPAELTEFLIERQAITPYHAKVLSAGAAGPFDYGDYRVMDRVTEGPLEGLFRAIHQPSGHRVGLRFLPADASNEEVTRARKLKDFHVEIRSPYLSACYDLIELDQMRFIVVQDLAGKSLASMIKKSKPTIGQACRLVRELAEAVLPLHERGCVHGHVSAKNVLIDKYHTAKLLSYPFCDIPAGPIEGRVSLLEDTHALGRLLLTLIDGGSGSSREELSDRLQAIISDNSQTPPNVAQCVSQMLGLEGKQLERAGEVVGALAPFADESRPPKPSGTKPLFEAALRGEPIQRAKDSVTTNTTSFGVNGTPAVGLSVQRQKTPAPVMPKISVASQNDSPIVRGRRSSGKGRLIAAGVVFGFITVAVLGIWATGAFDEPTNNNQASNQPETPLAKASPPEGDGADDSDDGSPLAENVEQNVAFTGDDFWVSPTSGDELPFHYLPVGAQAYLAWRPAEWMAHPHGGKVLSTVPQIAHAAEALLQRHAGLPAEKIESIIISFLPGETASFPRTAAVIRTVSPINEEQLRQGFPDLDSAQLDGADVYFSGDMGIYLPDDDDHLLVSAPLLPLGKLNETESLLQLALANDREPALMNREFTLLRRASDDERMLTVIFDPNFPFTAFKAMWSGAAEEFSQPFRQFFSTEIRACALSAHFTDEDLFLEWRAVGIAEMTALALANSMQARVSEFPNRWEQAMAQLNLSDYSRRILYRLPRMLDALSEQTEAASYRDHATLRCYLPSVAADNLVFAMQLAMIETSATGPIIPIASGNQPKIYANVSDLLSQKKISLEIAQDTLEETINKFAMAAGVTVKIDGNALRLEGIAKNKTLATKEEDKSAGAVLRAILNTADGRLVYLIKEEEEKEIILVTTKAAAEERGETIPPEFSATSGGQD